MSKKGQSLSLNTIVIAAIALIVLIILIVLVVNQLRKVPETTGCEGAQKGVCEASCDNLEGTYAVDQANSGVDGGCLEGEVCCIKIS
jgi:hypothetical protein